MKHNWEYIKLDELALIKGRIGFRGYTKNDLVSKGEGAITLSPTNIVDYKISYEKCQYISWYKYEESPEIMIYDGDIIFAKTASIGKVAIVKDLPEKATINPQFVVLKDVKCLNEYLYYVLRSSYFKQQISLITNGVAIPTVSQSNMGNIPIPAPPIDIQKQIVSELDKLNLIIEKKKQQVKELDKLAQSIFYDMFGDPVENEMCWDCVPFNTVCKGMTKGPFGSDIKKSLFVPKSNDTIKVYIQINAIQKNENLGDYYITQEYFERKMTRFEVFPQDYIITCDGTLGKCLRLSESMERGIISASLLKLTLNEKIIPYYFESLWANYLLSKLVNQTRNAALIHLPSAKVIGNELIPLPPLNLQQSFAAKVEAIERQKDLINQSIREAQTLFDSRMEYYFGE